MVTVLTKRQFNTLILVSVFLVVILNTNMAAKSIAINQIEYFHALKKSYLCLP